MVDTGILRQAVLDLCRGTFDISALRAQPGAPRRPPMPTSPLVAETSCVACGCRPRQTHCPLGGQPLLGQYTFTLAHDGQFDEAQMIFDKARTNGSINAPARD